MDLKTILAILGSVGVPILSWLLKKNKLPKRLARWINAVGMNKIQQIIEQVEAYNNLSGVEKRAKVIDLVQVEAQKTLDYPIPEAMVGKVVDFVYEKWRSTRAKKK